MAAGTNPQQNSIAHSSVAPPVGGGRPLKLVKKLIAFTHRSYSIATPEPLFPLRSHMMPFTFTCRNPRPTPGPNLGASSPPTTASCSSAASDSPDPLPRATARTEDLISARCPCEYDLPVFNLVGIPREPSPLLTITAFVTYSISIPTSPPSSSSNQ